MFGALGRPFSPVAATAQGNYGDRAPGCTIDGSGMSPVPAMDVHAATAGTATSKAMWLSNGTLDTWIAFDLGEEREITGFHLWNYNEYAGNSTKWQNRGIKTAEVYVGTTMPANGGAYSSAGAAWGTLVQNMTFVRAPSTGAYIGEDYQFNTPVRGRYFQFKVTGSYAGASPSNYSDNYTGISEIKFYERVVDERVTRLASGTKTIADSPKKDVVIEEGTSGAAAPITLSASTVRANALCTERNIVYGGVAQVDAHGKTLALPWRDDVGRSRQRRGARDAAHHRYRHPPCERPSPARHGHHRQVARAATGKMAAFPVSAPPHPPVSCRDITLRAEGKRKTK